MKIMQIGVGRWGSNHLRVLKNLQVEVYVAEISESGRKKCLEQGIPENQVSDDFREFADIVSCVDVVTPASTHFDLCKKFLEIGKDIFIEKPLAESTAEAEELAAG